VVRVGRPEGVAKVKKSRSWRVLMLSLAISAVAAAPVGAAGPAKSKLDPLTVEFPAGVVCPEFAVRWSFGEGGNSLVFPARSNGDQLTRQVGLISSVTVTNLDTGRSVTIRGGGQLSFLGHSDGTLEVFGNGTVIAGYFPTDVGGPSMWLFRGHLHDTVDATFTATKHTFVGSATNLCAAVG
jgi:hypothetical protein